MTDTRDTSTLDGMTVEEVEEAARRFGEMGRRTAVERYRAAAEALRLEADRREREGDDDGR